MALNKESWLKNRWRPAMGWMYMTVCIFDFIAFPILWAVVQFWEVNPANDAFRQWNPLTLQGAGLFHVAMGAVLGVAAWSRGQEKLAGTDNQPSPVHQIPQTDQPITFQQSREPSAYYSGRTFTSKQGKLGPVMEEAEI